MVKIAVPKPAKMSFNKDRPISELLKSQVRHLHELEKGLPHRLQTGRNVEEITKEGDASHYIKIVMERLHPSAQIKVPRPAAGSFHKHRPISDLLRRQLEHFREAELRLPVEQQTGTDPTFIRLEHEAAEYIGKVTAALHSQSPDISGERESSNELLTAKMGTPVKKAGATRTGTKARKPSGAAPRGKKDKK